MAALCYVSFDYCDLSIFAKNIYIKDYLGKIKKLFQKEGGKLFFDSFSMVSFNDSYLNAENRGEKTKFVAGCDQDKFQATINLSIRYYKKFKMRYDEIQATHPPYNMFGRYDVSIVQEADTQWLLDVMEKLHEGDYIKMDYILTGLVILSLVLVILGSIYKDKNVDWMNISYTDGLKAIACIIVVLVHIPMEYTNKLQDMAGSFAYIGVSFFFMMSAYGCRIGIEKNDRYLEMFWKNRMLSLFIPMFVYYLLSIFFELIVFHKSTVSFHVDLYIRVLIILYFIFWCVWKINYIPRKYKDVVIATIVIVGSLITFFTEIDIFGVWPVEAIGFVYGLVAYNKRGAIYGKLQCKTLFQTVLLCLLAIIMGIVYLETKHIWFGGNYMIRIILCVVILYFLFHATFGIAVKRNSVLQKLGGISYEVFLGHSIVISYIKMLLPNVSSGIFICLVVIVTIVWAIVVKYISNKILFYIKIRNCKGINKN